LYKDINLGEKFKFIGYFQGCTTLFLTIREEHTLRLKDFENRVLRRIFRPKGKEVGGGGLRKITH
jgi:hypothetical protein